jgi:hypothetical protein
VSAYGVASNANTLVEVSSLIGNYAVEIQAEAAVE